MMKKITLAILFLCIAGTITFAQTLYLKPYGVTPRVSEEDTVLNYFDRPYNGLQNVGIETKIYLQAYMEDGSLSSPVWNLLSAPGGSTAAFGTTLDIDTSTQVISFIPDRVGEYNFEVVNGSMSDTLTLHAGLYLGVDAGTINCHTCHSEIYNKWEQTGHASMLFRGLEGTLSSHYGESCIKCHTVGYDENAYNDGFDDFGFVFPDTLFVGQYANMVAMYPDAMDRANIQCESCHGPGSGHFGNIAGNKIAKTIKSDNCGWCHDEGTHHVFPAQWKVSAHATGSDFFGDRSSCTQCHNGQGFVDYVNGKPQTVKEVIEITCATCHDPHDVSNEHQLRTVDAVLENGVEVTQLGNGALCANCHKSRRNGPEYAADYLNNLSSHYGPHHGPQTDILMATNAPTWGQTLPTSPHMAVAENGCVDCHMYPGSSDPNGNVILAGSHSFSMTFPDGSDNVVACSPCHGNIGTSFDDKKFYINGNADLDGDGIEEGIQSEVEGIMQNLAMLLPPYGSPDIDVIDSTWSYDEAAAYYNHELVREDRSGGIHNPKFTVGLLYASITALGGTTAVDPSDIGNPVDYSLSQNYPNPFNPTTTIKFSIPESQVVRLVVFDAIGRQVEELINDQLGAGYHEITWNAGNHASGIYFVKMAAGNFVETKKMLLLK